MAYDAITDAEIQVKKPVTRSLMTKIKENFEFFLGIIGVISAVDILNGDFEISSDTVTPDNWDLTEYTSGTAGLEKTTPLAGAQSLKFVHPGGASTGGGYGDSDYKVCGYTRPFFLSWLLSSTAAGTKNQVIIRWFDKSKSYLSATTIYDSVDNPTAVTNFLGLCIPPSGAKYYKVRLVGGEDSVNVAGTILFDMITALPISMFKIGSPAMGTIAEATKSTPGWQSIGTVSVNCPIRAVKTFITATVSGRCINPDEVGEMRIGVGTDYSSSVSLDGAVTTSYVAYTLTLETDTTGSDVTFTLWVNPTGGGDQVQAKMDAPNANYQASDEALI